MKRRIIVGVGACVVMLLAWFQFLWTPKGEELTEAKDRRDAAQNQAQELQVRLARLQAASKTLPKLEETDDRLRTAVPDRPELAEFMLDANAAALESGVDFLSITPATPVPGIGGQPSTIGLAISIKGGYPQLLDYLDKLFGLSRIVVIDSMQVTPESAGGTAPSLDVSLTGKMFTTEPPALPGVTATTVPSASSGSATTTVPQQVAASPTSTVGAVR
jgi:Tfp pilus assembly protein PilO